jgi:hypothetical protein
VSAPIPAQTFVDRVRARGVKVVEMPNWKTTNRNHIGPWSDVFGIVEHHTGSDTVDPYGYAGFLQRGSSNLIGPLCQFSTAPNGDLYMIGWGRCNHAGGGDPNVLAAVKADAVPLDRELKPAFGNTTGVDGNRAFYGNEIMYSGGHPMTAAQLETTLVVDTVICEYHHWTGASVIAHREWSKDKPDPGYQDQAAKRRMVNARLAGGTGGDEIVTPEDINKIAQAVVTYKVPWVDPSTGQQGTGQKTNVSIAEVISWIDRNNSEQTKALTKSIEAIPPCNVQIDVNALADRIVSSMGADLASKVIDALGERIKPGA